MNLDLRKFKKIKDDHHSAVLQHPEGHQIRISKRVLSPKMNAELSDLPMHLADGGEVKPEDQQNVQNPPVQTQPTIIINNGPPNQQPQVPQQPQQMPFSGGTVDWNKYISQAPDAPIPSKIEALKSMGAQEQNQQAMQGAAQQKEYQQALEYNQLAAQRGLPPIQMPQAPQMPNQGMLNVNDNQPSTKIQGPETNVYGQGPQQPQDPYGTQSYYDTYTKGLQEQKSGILGEAKAQSEIGRQTANLLTEEAQRQQVQQKDYQDHLNVLNQERQSFMQDYQNKHVDPNRFMNNMGAGQRIMKGIGLILGGMGGGLTHTENPAQVFLQNQINEDINSQKAELGKSENLLTANMKQFGNLRDATDMTRLMQTDIVKNQIAQAAASSQDPLVRSRAQQAIGQLDMQAAPIMSQMAMRKTLLNGMQSGRMDPAMTVRMIVPEHQQAEAFKELKEAQEQIKARDAALSAFEELNKINTLGNAITSPIQTPKQVDALRNNLAVQLARAAAGRVNEYEFAAAKQLFPDKGDDQNTTLKKRQALVNFIQEKMGHPILQSYGINLGTTNVGGRFNDQGQKKIQLGPPQIAGEQKPLK